MPERRPEPVAESAPAPPHDLPRVVIVGSGQTGRELARQLAGERRVVVLDTDARKLERLHEDAPHQSFETLHRDGTSALALRDAAGDGAEWVIAATDQDAVNIEVCRVAAELEPRPSTIGTLRESHRTGMLRATGAESIARPGVIANQIRNRIERSHQVATSLGLGRGEIREIQVLPTSPAVNVKLRDLGARKWLVAGIYRGDRFVVPDGDAVIEAGDRLLITGEPEVAPGAAEFLREGKSLFPLQFGSHIVVFAERELPEVAWREAEYLFRTSRARRFRIVAPEGVEPPGDFGVPADRLARIVPGDDPFAAARPDAGCVVIDHGEPSFVARIGLNAAGFLSTMARFSCPVLIPGASFPGDGSAAGDPGHRRGGHAARRGHRHRPLAAVRHSRLAAVVRDPTVLHRAGTNDSRNRRRRGLGARRHRADGGPLPGAGPDHPRRGERPRRVAPAATGPPHRSPGSPRPGLRPGTRRLVLPARTRRST